MIDYRKENRIAIFTINRPQSMNIMDEPTLHEFHQALEDFSNDPELWVGIITGAGDKAFCAGIDIRETLPSLKRDRAHKEILPATLMGGMELWKPMIAAINGIALGGGLELTLVCDLRLASDNARLGSPEVTLGIIPGWGGTQRLPRMIPWCKAAEMLMMGRIITADEAYRIGLINRVVPQDDLLPAAIRWANRICEAAPLAVRAAKEAMVKGIDLPLSEGLELENSLETYLLGTEDFMEGTQAFIEKRKPAFKAK